MSSNVKDTVDNILKNVPGIIGLMLMDSDGMPIYKNGRFDISPSKLSAMTSACHACIVQIGKRLNQSLITTLVEYESIKIYHLGLDLGNQLIVLTKTKESQFGMLKVAATKAMTEFSQSMNLRKEAGQHNL